MAEVQQREKQGVMFKNDKGGVEARPDYRGRTMINGTLYKIAAWIKTDRNGKKFMSMAFTEEPAMEQEQEQESNGS